GGDRSLIDGLKMEPVIGSRRSTDEVQQRDRVLKRFRDRRQGPREARAWNGQKRREPAGCAIVAIRHEAGRRFVRRKYGTDTTFPQSVVQRQALAAGNAENMAYAVRREGRAEMRCAVQLRLRGLMFLARVTSALAPEPMRYGRLRGASSSSVISRSPPSWLLKCVTEFSAASVRSTAA